MSLFWGRLLLPASMALLCAAPAHADEPLFGFIYTTDLLPKGGFETEQWLTLRHEKARGSFNLVEGRTEVSYGVTDSLQLSGYLIFDWTQAHHNAVDGNTTAPEQFSDFFPAPDSYFTKWKFIGVAGEAIWRVMSPYTDPVGLAFYLEPTLGNRFQEIEVRGIAQKNFLDDRLVLTGNVTWAPEIRELPPNPFADPGRVDSMRNTNIETDVNFGIGASYRFAPNWSIAWELQNEREINGWAVFARSQYMGNTYYAGPSIHYANDKFFATLTFWEQLPWANNYMDSSVIYKGRNYDVDFEKKSTRSPQAGLFLRGRHMRSRLLLIPVAALAIVSPAHAAVFMSVEQAQALIFPGASFTPQFVTLTDQQAKAIETASDTNVLDREFKIWRVSTGGWFIVDQVVGKHEFIPIALGLDASGAVKDVEILEYREAYGSEVRNPQWRVQFAGKRNGAALQLMKDIQNISGATLSSKHITDGVRRLLATHAVATPH